MYKISKYLMSLMNTKFFLLRLWYFENMEDNKRFLYMSKSQESSHFCSDSAKSIFLTIVLLSSR